MSKKTNSSSGKFPIFDPYLPFDDVIRLIEEYVELASFETECEEDDIELDRMQEAVHDEIEALYNAIKLRDIKLEHQKKVLEKIMQKNLEA